MSLYTKIVSILLLAMSAVIPSTALAAKNLNIPILCYHNLNPTVKGPMNMTPEKFESQIKWIQDNGFTIIPLKEAVAYLEGKRDSLPPKSVVVTADDGWQSNYTYLYPVVKKYHIPVTLFIYPETISEGKHALTWDELKELQKTGLFDIQAHTYSHPNFKQEKRKMTESTYEKFVENELIHSKQMLENKLNTKIDYLAWPYGIYDNYLEQVAEKAGYVMAFSIDARLANKTYRPMAQPRYMIVDGLTMKSFTRIVSGANS